MVEYFRGGEQSTYPKISRIQNLMVLERSLEECVRAVVLKSRSKEATRVHRKVARQQMQQQQKASRIVVTPALNIPSATSNQPNPPVHSPPRSRPFRSSSHPPKRAAAALLLQQLSNPFGPTSANLSSGAAAAVAPPPTKRSPSPEPMPAANRRPPQSPAAMFLAQLPLHGGGGTSTHASWPSNSRVLSADSEVDSSADYLVPPPSRSRKRSDSTGRSAGRSRKNSEPGAPLSHQMVPAFEGDVDTTYSDDEDLAYSSTSADSETDFDTEERGNQALTEEAAEAMSAKRCATPRGKAFADTMLARADLASQASATANATASAQAQQPS